MATNPFAKVAGPSVPRSPERYYPPGLATRLLGWLTDRYRDAPGDTGRMQRRTILLLRCLYASDCRPGELCAARWSDFDAANGVIELEEHETDGSTGRPRRIPLTSDLVAELVVLRDSPERHPEWVFTHRRGKGSEGRGAAVRTHGEPWREQALGAWFRQVRMAAEAEGLDIRVRDGVGRLVERRPGLALYDFRRSFTTDAAEAGLEPRQTADAQGHSVAIAERTYRTRQARSAVEAAEAVAARRRGAAG